MNLTVAWAALRQLYAWMDWEQDFACILAPSPLAARLASALVRVIFGPELSLGSYSRWSSPLALAIEQEVCKGQGKAEAYTGIWDLVWGQLGARAEHRRQCLENERESWFLRLVGRAPAHDALESWLGAKFLPFSGLGRCCCASVEPALSGATVELMEAGVWSCILHNRCAILVPAPAFVNQDDRGNLHCDSGPAWSWADGFCGYALAGVSLPGWAVTGPIRAERIRTETNEEVRRVMLERFGLENYLRDLGAEVVHQDRDGAGMPRRLLLLDEEQYVEVVCPSTGRVYLLSVPLNLFRCHDAVAWTFGMSPREYGPRIEA